MRHGNKTMKLGRTMEHRAAMLSNMAASLIQYKRIETTLQKAKALRRYIEPIITKAKNNTTHSRRVVFSHLQSKEAIKELFGAVATAVGDRPGGYVRIIRMGVRHGDSADMAMIELVDFNTEYSGQTKTAADDSKGKKRRTRRSGGGSKTTTAPAAAVAATSPAVAEVAEEDLVATGDDITEATTETGETPAKDEE